MFTYGTQDTESTESNIIITNSKFLIGVLGETSKINHFIQDLRRAMRGEETNGGLTAENGAGANLVADKEKAVMKKFAMMFLRLKL